MIFKPYAETKLAKGTKRLREEIEDKTGHVLENPKADLDNMIEVFFTNLESYLVFIKNL
jgi:hypothetical protein